MSNKNIPLYNIKNNGGKTMNWGNLPPGTKIVSSYDGSTFSGPVKVGTPTPKGIKIPYYHVGEYVESEQTVYTHMHRNQQRNSFTPRYYSSPQRNSFTPGYYSNPRYYSSPSSYSYSGGRMYRGNYSSNQKRRSNQAVFL